MITALVFIFTLLYVWAIAALLTNHTSQDDEEHSDE